MFMYTLNILSVNWYLHWIWNILSVVKENLNILSASNIIYIYIHIYIYIYIYIYTYIYIYIYTYIHTYMYIYTYMCMYVLHVYSYVHTYVYINLHPYINMGPHVLITFDHCIKVAVNNTIGITPLQCPPALQHHARQATSPAMRWTVGFTVVPCFFF